MPRLPASDPWQRVFAAAFACFAIGAAAGALFRLGVLHGFGGLMAGKVRHAHSHLMLMGWVTPAAFALMAGEVRAAGARPLGRAARAATWSAIGLALLSFPAFARWGYEPVAIGEARIPIAAAISGVAMVSWYVVVGAWFVATRGVRRTASLRLWDAALGYLVLASLGAWGLAFTMMRGVSNPFWPQATLHLFVDLFGDGWLLLALLALLVARAGPVRGVDTATATLVAALPPVFLLAVDPELVPPLLKTLAHAGIGVAGASVLVIVVGARAALPAAASLWRVVCWVLALRAAAMVLAAWPPLLDAAIVGGARVPYLHLLFVGALTPALYRVAAERWGRRRWPGCDALLAACVLMLLSLAPLTSFWPRVLGGMWVLRAASGAAIVVTLVAATLLALHLRRRPASG